MAGTKLWLLQRKCQITVGKAGGHGIAAMAVDHAQSAWLQRAGSVDNVRKQGLAGEWMENFGQCGLHAFAHAGGEDDDVHDR